jgi:RHS repeat-associated protein
MTGYSTGTGNRLTNDGTYTYTYDDECNLTKKSKGANAETWTYGYDHRNQMTWAEKRATDGGTLQMRADYKYDAFGNRIEKAVDPDGAGQQGTTTTRFVLDGWKVQQDSLGNQADFIGNENWDVWADLDGNNALQTRYLRGDTIDSLFARVSGGGTAAWFLQDRLGSVRDLTDNSGVLQDHINYDGYGNVSSESSPSFSDRYKWTGREYDSETIFQFNRSRYYNGTYGRWTSQDPLGFDAGDKNLYRYVKNQPTLFPDPSGLELLVAGDAFDETPDTLDYVRKVLYRGGLVFSFIPLTTGRTWVIIDNNHIDKFNKAIELNKSWVNEDWLRSAFDAGKHPNYLYIHREVTNPNATLVGTTLTQMEEFEINSIRGGGPYSLRDQSWYVEEKRYQESRFPNLGSFPWAIIGQPTAPPGGRDTLPRPFNEGIYNCFGFALETWRMYGTADITLDGLIAKFEGEPYKYKLYVKGPDADSNAQALDAGINPHPNAQWVAIYERNDNNQVVVTHAAIRQPDGKWKSKLGPGPLIWHTKLIQLEGGHPAYGKVFALLYRKTPLFSPALKSGIPDR